MKPTYGSQYHCTACRTTKQTPMFSCHTLVDSIPSFSSGPFCFGKLSGKKTSKSMFVIFSARHLAWKSIFALPFRSFVQIQQRCLHLTKSYVFSSFYRWKEKTPKDRSLRTTLQANFVVGAVLKMDKFMIVVNELVWTACKRHPFAKTTLAKTVKQQYQDWSRSRTASKHVILNRFPRSSSGLTPIHAARRQQWQHLLKSKAKKAFVENVWDQIQQSPKRSSDNKWWKPIRHLVIHRAA